MTKASGGGVYCKHEVNLYGVVEVKEVLKRNYKMVLGIIIGILISGVGVYATITISSSNVSYNNSQSGLKSTDIKGAIDELYEKTDIRKQGNYVSGYTYSTENSTKCITGEENTCKKSTCYKSKTSGSCKSGDIIKYKVNDTDIVTFHVMNDNGPTLTMQSQKNIINNIEWNKESDNTKGPMTVLPALEKTTKGWSNVNDQTYTMGSTSFDGNSNTGCKINNTEIICTRNRYTLEERTAKARMITAQEAAKLGCRESSGSCPIWMYNYLAVSTYYGGTMNDKSLYENIGNNGYWTMSTDLNSNNVFQIDFVAMIRSNNQNLPSYGARAVVVVSK